MRLIAKFALGATILCGFSAAASAQVRTFGPAAPYLVTGRSVSVPAYHQQDQQSSDESGLRSGTRQGSMDSASPSGDPSAAH